MPGYAQTRNEPRTLQNTRAAGAMEPCEPVLFSFFFVKRWKQSYRSNIEEENLDRLFLLSVSNLININSGKSTGHPYRHHHKVAPASA